MAPKKTPAAPKTPNDRTLATNRRARHEYSIADTFEAGIVLIGSEVKSLRTGNAQIREAFVRVESGEAWLFALHIPPYANANGFGAHDPDRKRKLLLHAGEIKELAEAQGQKGSTIIPLELYLRDGKVKIRIGVGKGRKTADKRSAIAERDAARELDRDLARRRSGK
jgi:SsrA-binding protein